MSTRVRPVRRLGSAAAALAAVLKDDLKLPDAGASKIRIIQASVRAPVLDVRGANGKSGTLPQGGVAADGTTPGDRGPAVLAGHVDSKRGPAVFHRLREIETGDKIEITRGHRTVNFTVTSTAWFPKKAFPRDRVYGPTPDRRPRLITCGGVFDGGLRSYQDDLVVYAVAG